MFPARLAFGSVRLRIAALTLIPIIGFAANAFTYLSSEREVSTAFESVKRFGALAEASREFISRLPSGPHTADLRDRLAHSGRSRNSPAPPAQARYRPARDGPELPASEQATETKEVWLAYRDAP